MDHCSGYTSTGWQGGVYLSPSPYGGTDIKIVSEYSGSSPAGYGAPGPWLY